LLAAAALLAGSLAAARPVAAAPCGNFETVLLNTFNITMETTKRAYKVGENAVFDIVVTRPAHEDPLGQGQRLDPPMSMAAPDVQVGVGVAIDDVFLYGFGQTDQNGRAQVKVKLRPFTPAPATAFAVVVAQKRQVQTVCANVDEFSLLRAPNAFKTKPR
jgi:hypothetical protein